MMDKVKNVSKCYGFVNFALEEDAAKAIAGLNNSMIGDKRLTVQVKRAKSCFCLLEQTCASTKMPLTGKREFIHRKHRSWSSFTRIM